MITECDFLIIDDSEIDQTVTKMLLSRRLGITKINGAVNGEDAIQWINSQKNTIGSCLVILLDIRMPIMDGFQFLEAFSSLEPALQSKTRIVMLSSTLDPQDIERAKQHASVKKLLSKPLHVQELASILT